MYGDSLRNLIFMDPATGEVRKKLHLQEIITTRPIEEKNRIIVGTQSGRIIVINPEGIR